ELTGLSTGPRPVGWSGPWVDLPDDAGVGPEQDVTAHGRLHYVPLGSRGLSARMAMISAWIETARPEALVVDVSVEVALLARLHGVPVLVVAQPGHREDPAHRLSYDVASRIIAPWPRWLGGLWGSTAADLAKTRFVGAISRFAPVVDQAPAAVARRVVVVNGTGGRGISPAEVAAARLATQGWQWIHLDRAHGTWVDDPWPLLCSASVVISHAGQNLIAEIAAARLPALLLPQDRPFDEQRVMAAAIAAGGLPALVRHAWPPPEEWPELLARLSELDGSRWSSWNDGAGAARMAGLLTELEPAQAVSA
ncbi:MAG TPA: glycosyltransferase, partial [Microlunatus sp.]